MRYCFCLSYFMNGKWLRLPGEGLEYIEVISKNNIWGLKNNKSIWHWDGSAWKIIPGKMNTISVSRDGTVAGIGVNKGAYLWDGEEWIQVRIE